MNIQYFSEQIPTNQKPFTASKDLSDENKNNTK